MNETTTVFRLSNVGHEYMGDHDELNKLRTRKKAVYINGLKKLDLISQIQKIKLSNPINNV